MPFCVVTLTGGVIILYMTVHPKGQRKNWKNIRSFAEAMLSSLWLYFSFCFLVGFSYAFTHTSRQVQMILGFVFIGVRGSTLRAIESWGEGGRGRKRKERRGEDRKEERRQEGRR